MNVLSIILSVLLILDSVALIIVILLQSKRNAGFSATLSGQGETYWSKNQPRSKEGMLERYTKIGAALFIIISLALNFTIR